MKRRKVVGLVDFGVAEKCTHSHLNGTHFCLEVQALLSESCGRRGERRFFKFTVDIAQRIMILYRMLLIGGQESANRQFRFPAWKG